MKKVTQVQKQFIIEVDENDDLGNKWFNEEEPINLKSGKKFEQNPFVYNECGQVVLEHKSKYQKKVIMKDNDVVFMETGEIVGTGDRVVLRNQLVDEDKFAKIYVNQMSFMYDLSKSGIKVLHYIVSELVPNNDLVYIYLPRLLKFCGYKSNKQGYVGLKELIKAQIIAPSFMPGQWFINPSVIFNGNRLLLIQQYEKKKGNEKALEK